MVEREETKMIDRRHSELGQGRPARHGESNSGTMKWKERRGGRTTRDKRRGEGGITYLSTERLKKRKV